MKNLITYLSVLLVIILLSTNCKEYKNKDLYGTWTFGTRSPTSYWNINCECVSDSIDINKVTIEFKKNGEAYLNYSKGEINIWNTPYKCGWFLKHEKNKYYLPKHKYWFLYIIRYDTLGNPCPRCPNFWGSAYKDVSLPDTTIYVFYLEDDLLEIELVKLGYAIGYYGDIFFMENSPSWFSVQTKILKKVN